MNDDFSKQPILNSPYQEPRRHWELDEGQPTQKIISARREANFVTSAIPAPQKIKGRPDAGQQGQQLDLGLYQDETTTAISTEDAKYELARVINALRFEVSKWRDKGYKGSGITPETECLLNHWRHHQFGGYRPFFCQIEAAEIAIWLTELAPKSGKTGQYFIDYLAQANGKHNPGLNRLALKLATGAGKTAVMAMLIAWQTINASRRPNSKLFTNGFLVVTPGLTIKDRLRVLLPTDVESYYQARELVPHDMLHCMGRAKIVITNYHAFKQREKTELSKVGRGLLEGRHAGSVDTVEPEGQMLQRVMGSLMGMKNIVVFNDEGHHCYRAKQGGKEGIVLQEGEDMRDVGREAEENNEAARLWISGLEIAQKRLGISRIFDLSATPFFLRGSGEPENTLFPWTMSDFSLMDAIECGIVKLPRVPIADNHPDPSSVMPKFRELWKHIGKHMPKKGRTKHIPESLDSPQLIPLIGALSALYGHYEDTFHLWEKAGQHVPPCFIIVCNNTSTSKLLYDYISGYAPQDGGIPIEGRCGLFSNYDKNGNPYPRARTLLIDSHQLESGEKLSDDFRKIYADEIERFRHDALERGGALADTLKQGKELDDATILREAMNTVGRPGRLGSGVRCVVSVSMLTEGWDANNVTHILGVRAFGTQLLCEQVIGRALRRRSYELSQDGLLYPEYADVMGIPFDFTAEPVVAKPAPVADSIRVHAIRPERDQWEITFPRVVGYRAELPKTQIKPDFSKDSALELTTQIVGATEVRQSGIIGETADLKVEYQENIRQSTLVMRLTQHWLQSRWRGEDGELPLNLYGQLKAIVQQWLNECLKCADDVTEAFLQWKAIAEMAVEKMHSAVLKGAIEDSQIAVVLDPYTPSGSTRFVNFHTSKKDRWAAKQRCHLNYCMTHGNWENEFCRIAETNGMEEIKAYVKNYNLGFEVPYSYQGQQKMYIPDFVLKIDDGHGEDDLLNLVVEVKGQREEEDKAKSETMRAYWVPGINRLKTCGRWAFAEMQDKNTMKSELEAIIKKPLPEIPREANLLDSEE
jgi:type III restriction enzyme